jgi:hypothetical protein
MTDEPFHADLEDERIRGAIELGIAIHPDQQLVQRLIAAGRHRTYARRAEPQAEHKHPGDAELEFYLAPIIPDEEGEVVPLIRIPIGQLSQPPQG